MAPPASSADEPDVFTLSLHQEANYPVPKADRAISTSGSPNGTGDAEYERVLAESLERGVGVRARAACSTRRAPIRSRRTCSAASRLYARRTRDAAIGMVLEGAVARGIPAVVTLGGGYARRVEDTVRIHAANLPDRDPALSSARGPASG